MDEHARGYFNKIVQHERLQEIMFESKSKKQVLFLSSLPRAYFTQQDVRKI